MRTIRMPRRSNPRGRSVPSLDRRSLLSGFGVVLLLGTVGVASAAKPPMPPTGLSAFAFVDPTVQYLGDSAGTDFRFNVRNAGTLPIGAVEIARPSTSWLVTACPEAPAGWSTQRSDNFCRYRSESGTADDIQPGGQSDAFVLRATTAAGTANRTGTFKARASSSNIFDSPSTLKPAPAEGVGLTITAFSFQITDAIVGTGTAGAACPAATAENHSAITGSTQTILICGRNRMTIAATPSAPPSTLDGTFIADDGSFSSASIPAGSGNVILGVWTGADVTSTAGAGQNIVARIGSTNQRTSPITTLDDVCGASPAFQTCIANGGYEALNQPPDAVDDSADANEDGPVVAIDVLANDSDPDGDPLSITATGGSPQGLITITGSGSGIDYDPNGQFESLAADETDTDTFTYTIEDTFGATDTATVTVTITGQNDDPDAVDDGDDADEDGPAIIIDVLANDTDTDASDVLSVASVDTTGTTGSVTNNGTDVTYDPNGQFESLAAGETATDTFTYTVSDGQGATDAATVTVTVHGQNDDPVANDDADDAEEDGPAITINVLANDTDADASDVLTISSVDTTGTLGSVTNNGTDVTYDPDGQFEFLAAGETAIDAFTYTVSDGNGGTGTAVVTVTIHGQNDGPDAVDDVDFADEDGPAVIIDVLANDTDGDGDTLTVGSVDTTGTLGSVTNNGTDVTYDPNGQFESLGVGETDTDTFTYTASDGNGGTDTATVTVTITGQNDPPTATDDADDADEAGPQITIDVLANDIDADATDVLVVTGFDDTGTVGSVTDNGDGTFGYDPNGQFESLAAGETALDTFTYDISDGNGGTDSATVTVTVHGQNDDPTANDDTDSTSEFDDVDIDVLANDTDPDASDVLTVQSVDTTGTVGLVTNNGTDVTYDPNGQFDDLEDGETDTDTFTYTVSDGNGGTDTAIVTVTIIGITDIPPTAVDDSATVAEDPGATAIDVLANDMNTDGGPMTISLASDPANGTVVLTGGSSGAHTGLTYEPDPNFCNDPPGTTPDTFTYTLNGGSTATVSVEVTCVNDLPVATDDVGSTDENTPLNVPAPGVLANDTDADGPSLSVTQLNGSPAAIGVATAIPSGALVTLNANGSYTYDPDGTFELLGVGDSDTDSFAYTVGDGAGGTDTATVTITITGVNDAPTAVDDSGAGFITDEDTPFTTGDVLANDTDPDGDTLTIVAVDVTGTLGTLTYNDDGTFEYDPDGQFDGLAVGETATDTFTYTISDGNGGFDDGTVTITITGVNDAPTANDDTDTTDEDTAKVVDVLANDTDPDTTDTLAVSIVTTPDNGGSVTITNAGANVTLDPGADFQDLQTGESRNTSFTYTASDGNGGTDTATVTITVTGVSDAPVADDETFDGANSAVGNTSLVVNDPTDGAPSPTGAKKSITGDILDGDTDVDGPGPLTVTAGTFPTNDGGSVTIEADGDFTFQPAVGTSCSDVSDFFDYTLEDSGSPELTDTGRVTISIAGCVWYVKNDAAAGGQGGSNAPFDTLEEADVASGTGSTIYVFRGNGATTGLTTTVDLLATQRLHGEAIDLVVNGATLFTGAGGQRPNLAGNILLDDGNHLSGFAIAGAAVSAIAGGVGDASGAIADVVVTGSAGGVQLSGTSGTWNLSDLSVATTGGEAISISSAGTVNFTGTGTISVTSAAGAGVRIIGTTTSGVIDSVTVTSSPNEGIVLDDNPGALTVNDINLTTTGTGLLVDSSNDVTIDGGDADITSAGAAVSLTTVTSNPANRPDVTLDQVTSTGGTVGIFIDDIAGGTFSAAGGSLSGHSLAEIDINFGDGNISYGGTIGNGTGLSVEVSNRTGGAVALSGNINDTNDAGGGISMTGNTGGSTTFSGATKTLNTGALSAVALVNNPGHTINLNGGGLDIDTSSGAGLSATAGGTVQVTTGANPNTIDTGTGTAVNVNATNISNAGMTFRAVSSNGGTNGIVLSSTGTNVVTNGSFVITGNTAGTCGTAGTIADCSGGTITGKSGDAISLSSTLSPSFTRVNLANNNGSGVAATGVSGLTVAHSRIDGSGDTAGISEAGISLTNVSGTTSVTSSTVRDSFDDNVHWNISSGTGTVSVASSNIGPTNVSDPLLGNSGIQIVGTGTGVGTLNVTGSTFDDNNAMGVGTSMANSSALTLNVSTSTFTDNNMAVAVGVVDNADITFDINNNTALRSETNAFQVLSGETSNTASDVTGFIRNNTIGNGTADSGARDLHGIAVELNDDADGIISILNNVIRNVDQHGIFVTTRDLTGVDPTPFDTTLDVHIRDNVILSIDDNSIVPIGLVFGMLIDARSASNMCLDINSNDSVNIGAQDIRVRQRDTSTFRLERFVGNGLLVSDVESFIIAQNDPGTTADATLVTGFMGAGDGTCRDP